MQIISRSTLFDYWKKHPETKASLEGWIRVAKAAKWASMNDIQSTFPKGNALNDERFKFEICGGNYRLIVSFYFPDHVAFVKFIGTHEEYDRIDALTVSYF